VRWLADECVAASLVAFLRISGHDVLYVAEAAAGMNDADVMALAWREKRLLLTEDKDFGEKAREGGTAKGSSSIKSSTTSAACSPVWTLV